VTRGLKFLNPQIKLLPPHISPFASADYFFLIAPTPSPIRLPPQTISSHP